MFKHTTSVILGLMSSVAVAQSVTTSEGPKQFGAINTAACVSSAPAAVAMQTLTRNVGPFPALGPKGSLAIGPGAPCPAGSSYVIVQPDNDTVIRYCSTGASVSSAADVITDFPVCLVRNTQDAGRYAQKAASIGGPSLPHYETLMNINSLCNMTNYVAPKYSGGCVNPPRFSQTSSCSGTLQPAQTAGVCPAGFSWRNAADIPSWQIQLERNYSKTYQTGTYWGCYKD